MNHHPDTRDNLSNRTTPRLGTDLANGDSIMLDSSLAIVGRPGAGATITALGLSMEYQSAGHSVLYLDSAGDLAHHFARTSQPQLPFSSAAVEERSRPWPVSRVLDRLEAEPSQAYFNLRDAPADGSQRIMDDIAHWLSGKYQSGIRPSQRIMLLIDRYPPVMAPHLLRVMECGRDYFHLVLTMTDTDWLAPESWMLRGNIRQRLFLSATPEIMEAEVGDFVHYREGIAFKKALPVPTLGKRTGWCTGACGQSVIRLVG